MKPLSITYVIEETVSLSRVADSPEGHIASARVELWNLYRGRFQANFVSWTEALTVNNSGGPLCEMALTAHPVESET